MAHPSTTVGPSDVFLAARTRLPRLHVLTDTRGGRDPLPDVRAVVAAAEASALPVAIQVRAKEATDRDLLSLTCRVVKLCRGEPRTGTAHPQVTVIVDDRVDIAVLSGAHGVHMGAHDLPVDAALRLLGPEGFAGGTARTPDQALHLEQLGAAYLGVGPAYPTTTKAGLPEPLGPTGVQAVSRATRLPVIAIGGVTPDHVPELRRAGAHGVAVVSAVSGAADPLAATARLLRSLQACA
jgi:thiamine-phosphate pyrophosphorylase